MLGQSTGMAIQSMNRSHMEDGGTTSPYQWVSHTWQPQVITTFGEHKVKDLLRPPKDADMLRAGGHLKEYTPPSERAMSTERPVMQMGGDLTIDNRGDIEFMGYNPETAKTGASGFIGISRGPSHDNGGFNIKYAGNHVEIEGGETIMEKKDGGPVGDTSLNVLGNLKTGILGEAMLQGVNEKTVAKLLKGRKIKDVKYKHLGNDIAKKTKSLNKQGDKYSELASSIENSSIFDKLALNSAQAGLMGINMQYKDLNTLQNNLMMGQAAVNDTAEEMGLVADDLAKGKVKVDKKAMKEAAKFGKMISAQTGIRTNQRKRAELRISKEDADSSTKKLEKLKALRTVPSGQQKGEVFYGKVTQADFEDMMARNPWYDWENFDPSNPDDVEDFQMAFNREAEKLGVSTRLRVDGALGEQTVSAESLYGEQKPVSTIPVGNLNINELKKLDTTGQASVSTTPTFSVTPYKKDPLLDLVGQVLPYLRTPDQEELDPRQLTGEMYALSTNELEPVQAQTIQPQLSVPYDISLQDILNENEATFRSQQRLMGYNPAAQSQLNAQKYAANQKVLAEQFRLNQAMKDQVYRENRNLLNQFGLKNLEILDRQYVRQAEAKSKTKAVTQAALNSIGDKFMRNQLENRTLAVMENMFNYRYDPMFRTVNTNAPFQPQIPTVYVGNNAQATVPQGTVPAAAPSASQVQPLIPINFEQRPYTMEELSGGIYSGKTGVKVDKKKSLNSSVLKAFKNL
jgi:hypothetical protein